MPPEAEGDEQQAASASLKGKFNPLDIVQEHHGTLRAYSKETIDPWDASVFYGLPLLACGALLRWGVLLDEKIIGILVTSMSVFAALLFNLLLLVYDIVCKPTADLSDPIRTRFLKEIYTNISFAILTSLSVIVFLMTWLVIPFGGVDWLNFMYSGLVYYLIGLFLMTLLMVLKRVYFLLARQFD